MNKLDVNNTHNGRAFLGVVLAVLLLSVSGWGRCQIDYCTNCVREVENTSTLSNICDFPELSCTGPDTLPSGTQVAAWVPHPSYSQTCRQASLSTCRAHGLNATCYYPYRKCAAYICTTTCETDSARCVNAGNAWREDASASCGKSCKINHCKIADSTWLSTSIAACTGSNNYAIVNTNSTCEHVGTCCPNDSIPSGNACKWRCDSVLTTCGNRTGELFGGVLPDTSISGQDTTFSYQCYYNCSHSPNPDSSVYLVEGNIVLSGPNDSIPDGIKSETFNSVRTTTGGVYVYDYLSPAASEYIDSIAAMKCVEHLWRCVINNKYVYWYDNQEVPAGCTNIVRVK